MCYKINSSMYVYGWMYGTDVGKLVYSSANRDFIGAARHLCSEALIMGSTDNITVVIIDLRFVCIYLEQCYYYYYHHYYYHHYYYHHHYFIILSPVYVSLCV